MMRRILLSSLLCAAACGGFGAKKPTGSVCEPTQSGAGDCEGAVCLAFYANQQSLPGVCSQACTGFECGSTGLCLDIGNGTGACFQTCFLQSDCRDGFVCVALTDGSGRGICFVTANNPTGPVIDPTPPSPGPSPSPSSSPSPSPSPSPLAVTDIDGNTYQSVLIGAQRWMTSNLNVTRYRDGSSIPELTDSDAWRLATTHGRCNYENNASYPSTYGRLYNWYAVNTGQLCPMGWHVPSDSEWSTLEAVLGEASTAGGKLKESGLSHWIDPNTAANNSTGFTALPGGSRFTTGSFYNLGYNGYWWSATQGSDPAYARYRYLDFNSGFLLNNEDYKNDGLSVRCVKD